MHAHWLDHSKGMRSHRLALPSDWRGKSGADDPASHTHIHAHLVRHPLAPRGSSAAVSIIFFDLKYPSHSRRAQSSPYPFAPVLEKTIFPTPVPSQCADPKLSTKVLKATKYTVSWGY